MRKIIFGTAFCLTLLLMLVGCNTASKVEYTAENNTNIANILSELSERYSLADVSKNEIILKGTKTNDESYVDDGSISFSIYLDSDDWSKGCEAARYTLKRLSAMCSNDSISTIACFVYLNENGYYVNHSIGYSYNKEHPEYTILSITEFDSESLQTTYELFMKDYQLETHHTWEYEGIKYSDADLELKPGSYGFWNCDASLHFNKNYSVDELIKIGEYAHAFLGGALTLYALENDNIPTQISYDITVFGNEYYVTGENKDSSETLVWESKELE